MSRNNRHARAEYLFPNGGDQFENLRVTTMPSEKMPSAKWSLQLTKHYYSPVVYTYMHIYAKHYMYKHFKKWGLINHLEKMDWTWAVSMFRNVHHNFEARSALLWENGKWHLKMDDYYKIIVSKNFSQLINLKFRCLKLNMTPVWSWHDSIRQWTPTSRLHFERQMNSMKLRSKMTEDAISFLTRENLNKTQINTPRIWTGWNEMIYFYGFSFLDYFLK